jgi:hypothetical protein
MRAGFGILGTIAMFLEKPKSLDFEIVPTKWHFLEIE